jgi:hypothetical protein
LPDYQASKEPDPLPFWRKKPNVYKKLLEERRIVVTASTVKGSGPKPYHLSVKAAGIINAPFQFCRKWVQEYEKLPKVDSRFKRVKYYPDRQRIYLHLEAYGFGARMILRVQRGVGERAFELRWRSIQGSFLGMTGTIRVDAVAAERCEISLTGDHHSSRIVLPPILLNFGLEIVGQKVAGAMRSFIEEEYRSRDLTKSP